MTSVPLGELIRPAKVARAGNREYPLLSMTMHSGLVDQDSKFKKRIASQDTSAYKVIHSGQLVVGFPIDEGVLDFQTLYPMAIVSPAYGVWDLIHPDRVHPPYVRRFLRSERALAYYKAKLRGSTARRRSLPAEIFLSLRVPLPPLTEQRRIATILDQADALRAKRRQVLAHLDALTQSLFHDMFGDPLGPTTTGRELGDVAQIVTGNSPPRTDAANFGNHIEWIKSDKLGGYTATKADEMLSLKGTRKARVAPAGSILVTCIAGSPTSIGKASLVDRSVAFNQQINAILPSNRIDPHFLLAQLKSAPDLVRRKSTGGMKGLVSKSAFQSISVLVPPLESQRRFAERLRVIRDHTQRTAASQPRLDELCASLQSRAFRGEL